jgi:hypothetical protein
MREIVSLFGFVVSLTAFGCSIYFWFKTKKQNVEISNNISESRELSGVISENISQNSMLISSTTELLKISERIGIKAAYENRVIALDKFKSFFTTQDMLVVVGSSLKGLRMYVPEFDKILKARSLNNLKNRFLLTHPCYSIFREEKEFRQPGDIRKEIDGTLSFLSECKVLDDDIRLYLGTPTTFMVITRDAMLINPYPYQIESFRCFCLEVERKPIQNVEEDISEAILVGKGNFSYVKDFDKNTKKPLSDQYSSLIEKGRLENFVEELQDNPEHNYMYNVAPDIYGQFYWYHYLLPWYSKFSIEVEEYKETCKGIIEKKCIPSMRWKCTLRKKDKIDQTETKE